MNRIQGYLCRDFFLIFPESILAIDKGNVIFRILISRAFIWARRIFISIYSLDKKWFWAVYLTYYFFFSTFEKFWIFSLRKERKLLHSHLFLAAKKKMRTGQRSGLPENGMTQRRIWGFILKVLKVLKRCTYQFFVTK